MIHFVIAGIFIFISACSNNDLPVHSQPDSLRVMALIADQPEVVPGTSVIISP